MKPSVNWTALDSVRQQVVTSSDRPAGSFTQQEYRERYGLESPQTAEYQLRLLVQRKRLSVAKCSIDGKQRNVYWIPEQPKVASPSYHARRTDRIPPK